ncbi:4896_t:CDS:1, partial [Racocetra fulgida]
SEYDDDSDETTSTVSTPPGSPSRTRKVSDVTPYLFTIKLAFECFM